MNANRNNNSSMQIDARQAMLTMARVLDYVGVEDVHHAHRVAYIAYECSQLLKWPTAKQEQTFYAGLIHDCGVIYTKEHLRLLKELDPDDAQAHCLRGYNALRGNALLSHFAHIVRYHHTSWEVLETLGISQDDKDIAALIHIADRVESLRSLYMSSDQHPETIVAYKQHIADNLLQSSGLLFNTKFIDVMVQLVQTDGFWFAMDYEYIETMALGFHQYEPFVQDLSIKEITELSYFLANIVDAKSPFTYLHSVKVAQLSRQLALDLNLGENTADMIYVAGLLHDVGKLRTPDEILYKNGALEGIELSIMRRHSVDTLMTLDGLFPQSKIGAWAANHHEKIDGSGYPYQLSGDQLDIESRIIALADIFQALSQNRPYRGRMSMDELFGIITPMVEAGQLDRDVYLVILGQAQFYYDLSISEQTVSGSKHLRA